MAANGLTIQDDIEAGIALFITDETIEMPQPSRCSPKKPNEVATHRAFPG